MSFLHKFRGIYSQIAIVLDFAYMFDFSKFWTYPHVYSTTYRPMPIIPHLGFHPPRLQDPAWPGSHSVLQQRLRSVSQDGWCLDRRWPPWSNHRKIGILPMTLVVEWAWRYGRNITNNNPIGTIWWTLFDFTDNKSENRMIIGEYIGSIMAIQWDGGYDSRFWGIQWQFKEPPNLWCRHRFHGLDLEILNVKNIGMECWTPGNYRW